MARLLYRADGRLNQAVARDFQSVHHLRESISFYCSPLLGLLTPRNVWVWCVRRHWPTIAPEFWVLMLLGFKSAATHPSGGLSGILMLMRNRNLKRFLVEDYQCIAALWSLGVLCDQQFWRVMTSSIEVSRS